jgi:hypothetical protein
MKKGFFFTISVFLIAAVALEFIAFSLEQRGRLRQGAVTDSETLLYSIDALRTALPQALGANLTVSRNAANVSIFVEDAGFPYVNSTNGSVASAMLSSIASNTSTALGFNLSANLSYINSTGRIFSGNAANYTQNNSRADADNATLYLPASFNLTRLRVRVLCSMASATSVISSPWSQPVGAGILDSFFNSTSPSNTSATSSAIVDLSSNNSFTATYRDGSGNFLANLTMQIFYNGTDRYFSIYAPVNASAATKGSIPCSFNITADSGFTSTNQEIYEVIPIGMNAAYGGASYIGNLSISRS